METVCFSVEVEGHFDPPPRETARESLFICMVSEWDTWLEPCLRLHEIDNRQLVYLNLGSMLEKYLGSLLILCPL